jgi:hypothetical protein
MNEKRQVKDKSRPIGDFEITEYGELLRDSIRNS